VTPVRVLIVDDSPQQELAEAVRSTARGQTVLSATVAAKLVASVRAGRPSLTPREIEVLRCIADGRSNPETGRLLFISETTVKSHVTPIFEKLSVDDRTAAVTVAIARGILPPPTGR
jgi:DNA-binding NarL/FixJ family response regulator